MPQLLWAEIVPLHAQVSLVDSTWQDYPDWGDGSQAYAAGAGGIAVATVDEQAGPVRVEAWLGDAFAPAAGLQRIFNGFQLTGNHGLRLGNEEASDIHLLDVPSGVYWLEVWVD